MERNNPVSAFLKLLFSPFTALTQEKIVIGKTIISSLILQLGFIRKLGIVSLVFFSISTVALGQATYNWNQNGVPGDWTVATNWSPNRVTPLPNDILVFNNNGITTATNVPTQTIGQLILSLNSNVSLQSAGTSQLTIMGGAATDLAIPLGSTLQLSSTAGNQIGIDFSPAGQLATIGGTLILNANTGFSNSFNTTNSTTIVTGTITNNGGVITSAAGDLNFSVATSTYTHARDGGVIPAATWNAASNCNITGLTATAPTGLGQSFGNVGYGSAYTLTLISPISISGNLNITAGTVAGADQTINLTGNLTGAGGLSLTTGTLNISGNYANTGSFSGGTTSLVNYSGAIQNVAALAYRNLTISGNNTKTILGNVTVNNDLTVTGGTLSFGNTALRTVSVSGNLSGAGTIDISGGAFAHVLNLGGTTNSIGALTTAANGSVVNYNGAGAQTIFGSANYINLTVSTGGVKSLSVPATVSGDITISDPASLSLSANLTFNGTNLISNSNAVNSLNATSGLFTFALTGNQYINGGGTGLITFYDLTAGGNSTKTANRPFTVSNSLLVNNGVILDLGVASKTVTILGNVSIAGSLSFGTVSPNTVNISGDLSGAGTIAINGGPAHNLNLGGVNNAITTLNTTGSPTSTINYNRVGDQQVFANINYQNLTLSGGGIKSLLGNITVNNILNLNSGVLRLGTRNLTVGNNAINAIQGVFSSSNMIETGGTGALIRNDVATLPVSFPVGSGGYYSPMSITALTGTTGGTINVITVHDATLGSNFVNRYWDVKTPIVGGKTITASFTYDPAEITITPDNIWYKVGAGNWLAPTGTKSFGVNSFTITGTTNITTTSTYWTAGKLVTYYSYQTGDWNTATTWTSDPSGTLQIGSTVPGINDKVVILTGRTVSLSSDITNSGLDITINSGGFLNQTDKKFTNTLTALRGQGTLQLATVNFPAATLNTFVNTGGGTTEYNNLADFNFPASQLIYNNLTVNASGVIGTQLDNLLINGDLYVKQGNFKINDDASAAKLTLTINGNVTVDNGGIISVGYGATNPAIGAVTIGGAAPFIDYYTSFHTVIIKGNFTNNGSVRFTNLPYPVYNAFPATSPDGTTGAASVYFQGSTNNILICNGVTDFYNLILDKGTDQTYKLTINSTAYNYFRLFGANTLTAEASGSNANLRKALWIRTGTLVLEGSLIIPSLTEGNTGTSPNSDFYIPSNGALILNGVDVVVLSTADDYREINVAYGVSATSDAIIGVSQGGNSALEVYGKLQINDGYLSTRESGGIITSNIASGQIIINGGSVDTKQFLSSTGAAQYTQTGGTFYLRGRFKRVPSAYSTIANLRDVSFATVNTSRAVNGVDPAFGTFNLENTNNIFIMTGGTIRIYDVTGIGGAEQKAFDVKSSVSNINVTGGTLELIPVTGSGGDAVKYSIYTTAPINNLTINRASSTSTVSLSTALIVKNNLSITAGDFSANNFDVSIGGNFTIENGTSYLPGTNATTLNGITNQLFTVNLGSPLSLFKFTIDKPAGTKVDLVGSQNTLNVDDNFRLVLATLNDSSKTVNIARDVYNSGLHRGTGKIVLKGTLPQSIDGNGVFGNVELNNTNAVAAPVSLAANMTINGVLTFSQDKLFNIGTNNLKLNSLASISGATSSRYIQTSGNAGDGGLTRVYTSNAGFTFPIGAPTITPSLAAKYTPATIGFSSAPTTYGSITVVPVGYEHPNTTVKGQSLTYFWRVKSSGITGFASKVTHTFIYDNVDVSGTEANYLPALFNNSDLSWKIGTASNPPINTGSNTITDWTAPTSSSSYLDADYTAGDNTTTVPVPGAFGSPSIFYSRQNGLWSDVNTWSTISHTVTSPPSAPPSGSAVVIIGNNNTVNLTTALNTANAGSVSCATLKIEAGSTLDVGYNPSSVFSMVMSHPNGNGLFRLTTSYDYPATYVFPSGDFSDFNVNMGTTELYSTNGNAGPEYYMPVGVATYGNLILAPIGGSNLMFPNNDILVYGNLVIRGTNADSWFAPTWGTTYPGGIPIVPKTIHVKGNMDIQAGALVWFQNGSVAENFVVDGNVSIGALASLFVYDANATNQSMSIGGSLTNNANGGYNGVSTLSTGDFSRIPLTFFGANSATISSTVGTPITTFSSVTVNKGTSQATTLTLNIAGTLTTPPDNWLKLQNGTFIYNRTGNFNISQGTDFIIPTTAGLTINTPSNVFISNSAAPGKTLFLNGKLTILNGGGNVYVGPVGDVTNNADIEYSGSGSSSLDIQGGSLVINGQIRRPALTTNGVLNYNQSAGDVIIKGNNALTSKAKLEVLNGGSSFNMSGGTITIATGGGTSFGDLYLRPGSSSVTGGTIIFDNTISGLAQSYGLDANVPLNNITISGAAANASVGLIVSPLVLNGSLTLSNINSIFNSNNLNVSIKGNLNNSGTYNYGTNLTTFNGGIQSITGTTVSDFYNLNISPVTSLTVSNDFTVHKNLTIGSGNLFLGTVPGNKKITLLGDLTNNGSYTDDNTIGGISLAGSALQQISGTGAYGRLELNNSFGAKTNSDVLLLNDLILTQGILDISSYQLTLSQNSLIGGAPGITNMIISDGVSSSLGVRKWFPIAPIAPFTFPIGVSGKYTPVTYTVSASTAVGSIQVNPVNSYNPSVIDPTNVLKYYWKVKSFGISGFTGSVLFKYMPADVFGVESLYVSAKLVLPDSWYKSPAIPAFDNVNEVTHEITFTHTISNDLNGEYTAGNFIAIPGVVPSYQSNADGNWSDETIWTPVGTSPPCPSGGPNGANVIIDNIVTTDLNNVFALSTAINGELKIVSPTFGHNLGTVSGNGTLYLENGNLPGGDFTAFLDCSGNGTIEYGGTGSYTIIATQFNSIPNMFFTGTGTRVLPSNNLTICKRFVINGPTVDNSVNKIKLTILGTMERLAGGFISGTGSSPASTVTFAGSALQTLGGPTGDFAGANKFNNLEINNAFGLTIGASGLIEVNNELLLTNGNINTTGTNKLVLLSTSPTSVIPDGGKPTSFINGPLIKKIINGDTFLYPIGKGATKGHNLTVTSTAGSTLLWTAEYFATNPTSAFFTAPLQVVNSSEYWSVNSTIAATAKVRLGWDPTSNLTPLMTLNGIIDMRLAEFSTGTWNEVVTTALGDNFNGTVESMGNVNLNAVPKNYTIASVNSTKARAFLNPSGPICGAASIPLGFASFYPSDINGTLTYTIDATVHTYAVTSATTFLPTSGPGAYKLTGFTYTNDTKTGVVDGTIVNVLANPTPANAGLDQSLCGVSGTVLVGNDPSPSTGLWTIVSGSGGTFGNSTLYNSVFTGVLGNSYTLRWTTSNGACTSSDDVVVFFPVVAAQPGAFTSGPASVCQNSGGNIYTVPVVSGNTYTWNYTGSGQTITPIGSGNSVSIAFSPTATGGDLSVSAVNGCGASTPRTITITVKALPAAIAGANRPICVGASTTLGAALVPGSTYVWSSIPAGFSSTSPNPSVSPSATTTYTVVETNSAGCSNSNSVVVTVNPLPVPTILGPTPVCIGVSGNTYFTEAGKTNYVWFISAGGSVTSGGTATDNSVTVTWNTAVPQSVSVNYTDLLGCASVTPTVFNVTVNPLPTAPAVGVITQPTCAVATGSVALSGLPAAGTWTVTASPGSSTITGSGTTGTFNGLSSNTYTFIVTNASGCTSLASGSAVVNVVPAVPAAPTASVTLQPTCALPTGTIVVSAPLGAQYEYA
ncbi:MAG TPA: hypothetical protein VIK07_01790, partial [Bacteroidales bacterium]